MTKLSVNVNKLATLRNSRGKNNPNVEALSRAIANMGVHGLTVHPRPDGRHIRREDVFALKRVVAEQQAQGRLDFELNIEGYPSEEFMDLIEAVRPEQCTLVPDPPEALTSNAGWRVAEHREILSGILSQLKRWQVRSSLFVDPQNLSDEDYQSLSTLRPDRVELYTEAYAEAFGCPNQGQILQYYRDCARRMRAMGLGLNAGHDLNQQNLGPFIEAVPEVEEVSIGHALICEALEQGLATTVARYLTILKWKK